MSLFRWNEESITLLRDETRKHQFDFEKVSISIRSRFGNPNCEVSADSCRLAYAEEYASQSVAEDVGPARLDINDSMTFEEIMNVVEIRNTRSEKKKQKIFSRVLASLANPSGNSNVEISSDMEIIKATIEEKRRLKQDESERREKHSAEQSEIRWFEREREKLRHRHLPGSIDAEGEGDFPYPIGPRDPPVTPASSDADAESKDRRLTSLREVNSPGSNIGVAEIVDWHRQGVGEEEDKAEVVLPAIDVYDFDADDLFGSPYLDAVLEEIERDLDTKAESKEDSERDSSELSVVLAYLDKSAAAKRDVVRPPSSILPAAESACGRGTMPLKEKEKLNPRGIGDGAKPRSAKELAAISQIGPEEQDPEKQSVLLGEILSFSPSAVIDSKVVSPTALFIRPSTASRRAVADASGNSLLLTGCRGGGRGGYNRPSRAAAAPTLTSQMVTEDPDENHSDDDDDDDDEGWRSARNSMKSRASGFIMLPCPVFTKPITSLSSSSSNIVSVIEVATDSGESDGFANPNSSAQIIFIASSGEDHPDVLAKLAAEAAEETVRDIVISNADNLQADRQPVLVLAVSNSDTSGRDINCGPDGQSDPCVIEPQQHVSGSGSLLTQRSATSGRKRIVPKMLKPVQASVSMSVSEPSTGTIL